MGIHIHPRVSKTYIHQPQYALSFINNIYIGCTALAVRQSRPPPVLGAIARECGGMLSTNLCRLRTSPCFGGKLWPSRPVDPIIYIRSRGSPRANRTRDLYLHLSEGCDILRRSTPIGVLRRLVWTVAILGNVLEDLEFVESLMLIFRSAQPPPASSACLKIRNRFWNQLCLHEDGGTVRTLNGVSHDNFIYFFNGWNFWVRKGLGK